MEASLEKAKSPRATGVSRDPERTQASILAAATEEFTAKGLNGARVDAINRLLHAPLRATAVIGLFDDLALTVMEEAARAGKITAEGPDDQAVAGAEPKIAALEPGELGEVMRLE